HRARRAREARGSHDRGIGRRRQHGPVAQTRRRDRPFDRISALVAGTWEGRQMLPKLGIVADDYTGGLLVAGLLEAFGISAPVAFDTQAVADSSTGDVIILATRTRFLPLEAALDTIAAGADALEAAGCKRIA